MTTQVNSRRTLFSLDTAQTLTIVRNLPPDTKFFYGGSMEDGEGADRLRFIGKRDQVLAVLELPEQKESAPVVCLNGIVLTLNELHIRPAMLVVNECEVDDCEYCVLLTFMRVDDVDGIPELEQIHPGEMLKPQVRYFDPRFSPKNCLLSLAASRVSGSRDANAKFTIEDAYYTGLRWRNMAQANELANLQKVHDRVANDPDQDFELFFPDTDGSAVEISDYIGSAIISGVEAQIDSALANEFWESFEIEGPSANWLCAFCAGALRPRRVSPEELDGEMDDDQTIDLVNRTR